MAADRLAFLDPRNMYSPGLTSDFIFRGAGGLFPSIQFVPERIIQFSMTPEGIRYYKVQWQESWLPEHQLLQHQSLIEAYWRSQNELATNSGAAVQVATQKVEKGNSTNVNFLSDLNSLSEIATTQSTIPDVVTPDARTSSVQTILTQTPTVSTLNQSQPESAPDLQAEIHQEQQLLQPHQQTASQQVNKTPDPKKGQEQANGSNEGNQNIQVLVENVSGEGDAFCIQEIPLNVVLEQSITTSTEDGNYILTPKTPTPTWKSKPNTHSLKLEGFDLVNIENNTASEEELALQARETLSSFRRKRVRFPNGSSKLPQQCFFCLKTLSNRKKLREHQFSVHFKNVGEFMCGICKQRFVFGRQLKAHMLVHSDNRNFQCTICGLTCKRRSHLHKHMDTHRQEKNYRCDVCHQNFKVQAELKKHCFEMHKNQLSRCNVCKQTLHTPFSVYIHSLRHSGTRDHLCEVCGAGFKRKQHLIAHMNTHKDTKEKIKCPECEKDFPDKKHFRKHLEQFHKELAANYRYDYVCTICDKDFAYKGRLDEHMKAHENETEQERFIRGRKKRVDSLSEEALKQISQQAVKCVDPKTKEVKLRCTLCRKREFRMISSFEKHIQDHKEGRIKTEEVLSFVCNLCDKSFNSEKRLEKHRATHTTKASSLHVCSKCTKTFRWKSCLHAHIKKCNGSSTTTNNKGAEKRKATLKAKEKLFRQLRSISDNDDLYDDVVDDDDDDDFIEEEDDDEIQGDDDDILDDIDENAEEEDENADEEDGNADEEEEKNVTPDESPNTKMSTETEKENSEQPNTDLHFTETETSKQEGQTLEMQAVGEDSTAQDVSLDIVGNVSNVPETFQVPTVTPGEEETANTILRSKEAVETI